MEIIVFSIHRLAEGFGSQKRIHYIIDHFTGQGIKTRWINLLPVTLKNAKHLAAGSKYHILNIPYIRFPFADAIGRWMSSLLVTLVLLFKGGTNAIIFCEMSSSGWPLLMYKKYFHPKIIVDIHGTMDEIIQFEPLNDRTITTYCRLVNDELRILRAADATITVSHKMRSEYEKRYGFKLANNSVLPTSVDTDVFYFDDKVRNEVREKLLIADNFVFIYSGGMSKWQCIEETVAFYKTIQNDHRFLALRPILLLLVWDEHFRLQPLLVKYGIKEGAYCLRVEHEAVARYLMAADAGIIFRENVSTNIVSSPTKVGEYLNSGLPVLCTPYIGDISGIVDECRVGMTVSIPYTSEENGEVFDWCTHIRTNRLTIAEKCHEAGTQYFHKDNYNILNDIVAQVDTCAHRMK
jgi:glycosyltransferase involved in cell wall biosynthesis